MEYWDTWRMCRWKLRLLSSLLLSIGLLLKARDQIDCVDRIVNREESHRIDRLNFLAQRA